MGAQRNAWIGAVVHATDVYPLEAIRVVGSGMLRVGPSVADDWEQPSERDLLRWSRTRGALGEQTWQKVAASRVLLIGAGRSGSVMGSQLVALGIRSLTIVDPDRLCAENLDASYGFTEQDVGHPKAESLQRRLAQFSSRCAITRICRSVRHKSVVRRAREADLIVTCVDNDTPRLVAAILARRFLKLHLDVATGVMETEAGGRRLAGDARLLVPGQGCICCVGGLRDEAEARYELRCPPDALKRRPPVPWYQQRAGSLITLNSMTVSVAVQLWLDLLAGRLPTSHWHRLQWETGKGIRSDFAPVGAASWTLR